MFDSRMVRIRKWHTRRVLFPRRVNIEGKGERWVFFDTFKARWSPSRQTWLWRDLPN